jgi:hypothetical protein
MIKENILKVGRQNAVPLLLQKINGYRGSWRRVKIGATSDPERRWDQHSSDSWEEMVLIYKAYTPEIAREIEQELIAASRESNFLLDIENVNPGGEGLGDVRRSNYIYVLVGDKRRS